MKKLAFAIILLLALVPLPGLGETFRAAPGELGAALSQCRPGDVVELSGDVYDKTTEAFPLLVPRGVTVRPQAGAHPVIDAPAMVAAFRVEASDVTLEGLDIRMLRHGIYAVVSEGLTLRDCSITLADPAWRTSSAGIWLGGVKGAKLINCEFYGCSICMAGPPVTPETPNVPVLTRLFEVGEDPAYFTTHQIEGCTVNGLPIRYIVNQDEVIAPIDAGEIIVAGCGAVTVDGAAIQDGSMGLQLMHNQRVEVKNTQADRCGIFGVYVAKCGKVLLDHCASSFTNHGLDIRACQQVEMLNCQAWSCDQGLFFSQVDDGVMADCQTWDTAQGIFAAGGNHDVFLRCNVDRCETGIHFEKEQNAVIMNCRIGGCSVVGIRLERSVAAVLDNDFVDNWVGLMAYGNTSYLIAENRFTANRNCGLFLRNLAFSRILHNSFSGHPLYSLVLEAEMGGSLFLDNQLDTPMKVDGVLME